MSVVSAVVADAVLTFVPSGLLILLLLLLLLLPPPPVLLLLLLLLSAGSLGPEDSLPTEKDVFLIFFRAIVLYCEC